MKWQLTTNVCSAREKKGDALNIDRPFNLVCIAFSYRFTVIRTCFLTFFSDLFILFLFFRWWNGKKIPYTNSYVLACILCVLQIKKRIAFAEIHTNSIFKIIILFEVSIYGWFLLCSIAMSIVLFEINFAVIQFEKHHRSRKKAKKKCVLRETWWKIAF